MMDIVQRVERAAQSILENESLTADLNDEAAQVLLDWGITRAKAIAMNTVEITDDEQANEAMYKPMRALRRMLRTVNKWYAKVQLLDKEYGVTALSDILENAAVVYGDEFVTPDPDQQSEFLDRQSDLRNAPAAFIAELQSWIENPPKKIE